jgi:propionate CoA-transferase
MTKTMLNKNGRRQRQALNCASPMSNEKIEKTSVPSTSPNGAPSCGQLPMPMPRLTTLFGFSSKVARRPIILRSLISSGGSEPVPDPDLAGKGGPEWIAVVANEEKIIDLITLTAEPGVIGGIPASGLNFGAATNTQAVIGQPYQFDFYDGGGLDIAFLGLAQVDARGNLNVSKFEPKLSGAGGFINISQNAKKVVFVGTFKAGGLRLAIEPDKLSILNEGAAKKFIKEVEHVTFSGPFAASRAQPVLYITERCVFALTTEGLQLKEVAPGIDIERDILAQMDFKPIVPDDPQIMDARIFRSEPMGLRDDMLSIPLDQRFTYDPQQKLFFVNFERFSVRSRAEIRAIVKAVEDKLSPLGHRVYAIVNYDNFSILPELLDEYSAAVRSLVDRFYSGVSRYTTSGFLRIKLGEALEKRGGAPHIFESAAEAQSDFHSLEKSAAE